MRKLAIAFITLGLAATVAACGDDVDGACAKGSSSSGGSRSSSSSSSSRSSSSSSSRSSSSSSSSKPVARTRTTYSRPAGASGTQVKQGGKTYYLKGNYPKTSKYGHRDSSGNWIWFAAFLVMADSDEETYYEDC